MCPHKLTQTQQQQHQHQQPASSSPPRPSTPQQLPPFPTAANAGNIIDKNVIPINHHQQAEKEKQKDDEERASLISEIRRLENGALRASRDEMESLKEASAAKRAAIERMEEELKDVMSQMRGSGRNNGNNNGGGGGSSSNKDADDNKATRRPSSGSKSGTGTDNNRRPNRRLRSAVAGTPGEKSLRKSLILQNSMLRRVSASGDRPFFRRPPIKDVEA